MDRVVGIITHAAQELSYDDDSVDRLNHRYTSAIFVCFAVLSTMQQFVGNAISCWVPAEFTGSHITYANNYCWVKNTYWLPFENEVPKQHEASKRKEIGYYQWMPFIFLFMALFFHIPHQIWRAFSNRSGVDSRNIMEAALSYQKSGSDGGERTLRLMTNQIDRFLRSRPQNKGSAWAMMQKCISICSLCGKGFGNYLTLLYMLTKLLYIGNVFSQLFLLNSVLGTKYHLYGADFVHNLVTARGEQAFLNNTIFPRVTMCDFDIRQLGNVHRHTVQCLLSINLYTEKMFIFAWFWMVIVLFCSITSLVYWVVKSFWMKLRLQYVESHLISSRRLNDLNDIALCNDFVQKYLRQDGVFLFRLIGHNTDSITLRNIMSSLWDNWRDKRPAHIEPTANCHEKLLPNEPPSHTYPTLELKTIQNSNGNTKYTLSEAEC